ncbi:HlyD family efflux transporter periplasmic adaptor subunit [Pleurocapsales cyanobacterium LEGE 10410]|nr:HlyD family efflux transporter periplasmic adaptor subunit [Pleurocapsales cyanobacterium LEGE 10410]
MNFFNSASTISRREAGDIAAQNQDGSESSSTEVTKLNSPGSNLVSVTPNSASLNTVTSIDLATTQTSHWSPTLNQLLEEPPPRFSQLVTLGAMSFCLVFFAWSWWGKIDEVSKAQGKLIPQGKTYKVEPVEIGKVKYIAVREAQEVKAGQTLIELDTELVTKEVARLEQMLQAYRFEFGQKRALREQLALEAKTREDITNAEVSAQRTAISLAKDKVDTLSRLLAQKQGEVTAYADRQINLRPLSNLARERLNQLNTEIVSRQQRLDKLATLAEQGAVSQEYVFQVEQSLREAQRQVTQSQLQEVTTANEQIFQSDRARGELESQITSNQGELATTLKEIKMLEAELIQKQADGKRTQLETQQKIEQLEFELAQIESKVVDTQNLLSSAKVKLQQKSLKAPVDGVVLSLNVDNAGKVVQAGETVVEIAPIAAPLILSASILNSEAGFIEEGMPVQVKLDAYPYQYYGLISGEVTHLSADAKDDSQLGEVYQVEVALKRDHITENRQKIKFKAGQTATADIVIRRRRILDVWLEPIKKLQQDGMEI